MKSIIPDPAQLDELAAGLDAGWDEEPVETSPSQPPHSAPLPKALDELDADWEVAAQPAAAAPPVAARPVQSRRAETAPAVAGTQRSASKKERREAERKRLAHQAQKKSLNKQERKTERQAEARRALEQQRAAEQQAIAERRARQGVPRKPRAEPKEAAPAVEPKPKPKAAKRARREPAQTAPREPKTLAAQKSVVPVVASPGDGESTIKKLIPLILIALLLGGSMWFALSRAH